MNRAPKGRKNPPADLYPRFIAFRKGSTFSRRLSAYSDRYDISAIGIELENLHHIIIEECYERRFVVSSGEFIKYLDLAELEEIGYLFCDEVLTSVKRSIDVLKPERQRLVTKKLRA